MIMIIGVGLLACSATAQRRSFGEVVDDAVISNKIKIKYFKDKEVKGAAVNINTWKGVVTLKGVVGNQLQIHRAIEIAERQAGVREVKSYLVLETLQPTSQSKVYAKPTGIFEEKDLLSGETKAGSAAQPNKQETTTPSIEPADEADAEGPVDKTELDAEPSVIGD